MDAIRQWAFSLCTAAVVGGIILSAAPKSGTAKLLRLTVSVFFLSCLVSPVLADLSFGDLELRAEASLRESEAVAASLRQSLSTQVLEAARPELEGQVAQLLAEMEVKAEKIRLLTAPRGDLWEVTGVQLTLDPRDRSRYEAIRSGIEWKLNLAVEIRESEREQTGG